MSSAPSSGTVHVPILVEPIVAALLDGLRAAPAGETPWAIDATLGGGGHTAALLAGIRAGGPALARSRVLAVDQDPAAIARARRRFAPELADGILTLERCRFGDLEARVGDRAVYALMADLGFSSDQLEDGARGLAFGREGPLDMRLDPERGETAADWLAGAAESELEEVFRELGEERHSRRVARAVAEARARGELPATTVAFAEWLTRVIPGGRRPGQRIHPATRIFQSIRIRVNDELGELDRLLERVILGVRPGGRVAILSFHSLEDGRVKRALRPTNVKGERELNPFDPLTKRPVEPSAAEVGANPRARSARLRVGVRRG